MGAADSLHLRVSWFGSARTLAGTTTSPTWASLSSRLTSFPAPPELAPHCDACKTRWRRWGRCPRCDAPLVPDKRGLPSWSHITFDPCRRHQANATGVCALVLDYDSKVIPVTLNDLRSRWTAYVHLVHTSWSHRDPERARARVVLPFAAPISTDLWARVWAWAMDRDPANDPSCGDLARLYFLPFRPPGGTPEAWLHRDGELLDPHQLDLPPAPEPVLPVTPLRRLLSPIGHNPRLSDVLKSDPHARRTHLLAAGGRVRGEGTPQETVEQCTCPQCGAPSVWARVHPDANPGSYAGAACVHRNSCGWRGWVDQLGPAA